MAQVREFTGKTVEDAIAAAMKEMNVSRDRLNIEVLDEGAKGLFGLIGAKMARIGVTLVKSPADKVCEFLEGVLDLIDVDAQLEVEETEDSININLVGKDMGIIIGRRGETLDALQYLSGLVANKDESEYIKVVLDTENYRKKREDTLVNLAKKLADRVTKYKKSITLEPMNPYERRIIHSVLQNHKYVNTYSIGEEPNRRVVIALNDKKKA